MSSAIRLVMMPVFAITGSLFLLSMKDMVVLVEILEVTLEVAMVLQVVLVFLQMFGCKVLVRGTPHMVHPELLFLLNLATLGHLLLKPT